MKEIGLDARHKKKIRVQTTNSNHRNPLVRRIFEAKALNCLSDSPEELLASV